MQVDQSEIVCFILSLSCIAMFWSQYNVKPLVVPCAKKSRKPVSALYLCTLTSTILYLLCLPLSQLHQVIRLPQLPVFTGFRSL